MGVAVLGRFGAQCNRSTLSIVNHCHPSEATRLALHAANPLSVSTLAVCRSGREPHQKVLELGIETEWLEGGRMLEKRGGKMCRVEVVGGEGQGHSSLLNPGVGFRVRDGFERICTTQSGGQGGPVFIPPSIPPPFHPPPPPTTTCLQATTSVPREMSATEKKAHKGLTFHMAGSPRLKRPDNPRRLD